MPATRKTSSSNKKSAPSPKPRVRNPEQTRAKLLQATINLLSEKGSDAVSLMEAARVAKVSRAMAYRHFDDREHLLREAKAWIADQLLESAKDIQPSPQQENISQVTEKNVNSVAELVLNNREAARLLITDALAGKALEIDHPLFQMVIKDLNVFKASGLAKRDFDIEILSYIMLGTVATLIMLSHLPHSGNNKRLAKRFSVEWSYLLSDGLIEAQPKKARKLKSAAPKQPVLKQKQKSGAAAQPRTRKS
jgi:AcrR family transcriptional regulator